MRISDWRSDVCSSDLDPKQDPDAVRYDSLSYDRVLADNLKVMDASAVALCRANHITIVVFNIREPCTQARVLAGAGVATVVGHRKSVVSGKRVAVRGELGGARVAKKQKQ